MRAGRTAGWLLAGVAAALASGCVSTRTSITTVETRRVALARTPGAPLAVAGGSGMSLGVRMVSSPPQPQAEGGGIALAVAQPELGALLQFAERSYVSGKLALTPTTFGTRSGAGVLRVPDDEVTFELTGGAGHDVELARGAGLVFSGELGLSRTTLVVQDETGSQTGATDVTHHALLGLRLAAGGYVEPGPVRLYAAVTAGTGTWNDETGTRTRTCRVTCTTTETGRLTNSLVVQAGGGARWQPKPWFSLAVEAWAPLTANGAALPFTLGASLRLGDLDVRDEPRDAAPPPPALPAPPEEGLPPPPLTPAPDDAPAYVPL